MEPTTDEIAKIYREKEASINGRTYRFTAMRHQQRVKVFAFVTGVQARLSAGDLSFLASEDYAAVERVMFDAITFEGSLLSRLPEHFEDFPEDYVILVTLAMAVMCVPFVPGGIGGSAAPIDQAQKTSSKKPI